MLDVLDGDYWSSRSVDLMNEHAATWAADRLAEGFTGADSLYVATGNAGALESVEFWRSSLKTGFAFANPGPFPWTLANSIAGSIGQRLGIRGPTVTLIGGADALGAALEDAIDDLEASRSHLALVVAFDRSGDGTLQLAALLISPCTAKARDRLSLPMHGSAVSAMQSLLASGLKPPY